MRLTEKLRQWWFRVRCPTEFLCDNCRYDYPGACDQPARPNAVKCPDYRDSEMIFSTSTRAQSSSTWKILGKR